MTSQNLRAFAGIQPVLDIFRIIFDRRHVKDVRLWVILMIAIGFGCYHKLVITPLKDRQDRQGKKIRQIIEVAKLRAKIDALPKDDR